MRELDGLSISLAVCCRRFAGRVRDLVPAARPSRWTLTPFSFPSPYLPFSPSCSHRMGNCLSDPSSSSSKKSLSGGGQRLGSGPTPSTPSGLGAGHSTAGQAGRTFSGGGHTVGDGYEDPARLDGDAGAKAAAARAAEQRAQAVSSLSSSSSDGPAPPSLHSSPSFEDDAAQHLSGPEL